jgi:hypothetical protein
MAGTVAFVTSVPPANVIAGMEELATLAVISVASNGRNIACAKDAETKNAAMLIRAAAVRPVNVTFNPLYVFIRKWIISKVVLRDP